MSSLKDIQNNYSNSIMNINDYFLHVVNLFSSLCDVKQDLIKFLPTLYSSRTGNDISQNYDKIKIEILSYQDSINKEIQKMKLEIKQDVDATNSPYDATADRDFLSYLNMQIEKGQTDREVRFKESESILETLCITKGPTIHGERFYALYDNRDEVYKLIDIALNNGIEEKILRLNKDNASLDSIYYSD